MDGGTRVDFEHGSLTQTSSGAVVGTPSTSAGADDGSDGSVPAGTGAEGAP